MQKAELYTAADALNDALVNAGVKYIFFNSGTDYPPIIEAWAKCDFFGKKKPEVIICPHETVAMSAAHGYALATGEPQAVFVHVDVGTQNLGGTVHNVARGHIPVLIFAGLSPYTMEGELPGGRNAPIQYIQNVSDQAGIVREYVKHATEMRTGKNIQQVIYRALQIAKSDPRGPVYLTATREVLEAEGADIGERFSEWSPITPSGIDDGAAEEILSALENAENPLIITGHAGRNAASVAELVALCERLAVPVVESGHTYMNFPANHPLHLGFDANRAAEKADVILTLDCDLPWMPCDVTLRPDCSIYSLDIDPIKDEIPLWHIPAKMHIRADSYAALKKLNALLLLRASVNTEKLLARRARYLALHDAARPSGAAAPPEGGVITSEFLAQCISEVVDDDTIIVNEAITNRTATDTLIPRTKPGTYYCNSGSSLGWHGGAAIGLKLAEPEKTVVALTGDGSYIFSAPTAVYWVARRYNTPFMTVIFNNQGWNAPKAITAGQHPGGYAVASDNFRASLSPSAQLEIVAEAAGGAFARCVSDPAELRNVLRDGMAAVKGGRCAVINVVLPPV
ncbi:MAG: thiamine pyrophosphate-requiring protein [Clostridiales bacterium]|nr:thiamine pyrophosphate-requiring protein [Clostridiales bacterium]